MQRMSGRQNEQLTAIAGWLIYQKTLFLNSQIK